MKHYVVTVIRYHRFTAKSMAEAKKKWVGVPHEDEESSIVCEETGEEEHIAK